MCGLVGVASYALSNKECKAFEQLLFIDTLRGDHSTGLVGLKSNVATYFKRALSAPDFLQLKQTKKLINDSNQMLMGHNRYATKGSIQDDTAHPFTYGNVIGMHNGTMRTTHQLLDHSKFTVDSENIVYNLSKEGIAETYKKMNGSAALVWWDMGEKTINFLRNDERPLFYAITEDGGTLLWASEAYMIRVVAARNDLKVDKIQLFTTNKHYKFTIPATLAGNFEPETEVLEPYQAVAPAKTTTQPQSRVITPPNHSGNNSGAPSSRSNKVIGMGGLTLGQDINFYIDQGTDLNYITGFMMSDEESTPREEIIKVFYNEKNINKDVAFILDNLDEFTLVRGTISGFNSASRSIMVNHKTVKVVESSKNPEDIKLVGPNTLLLPTESAPEDSQDLYPHFNSHYINKKAWESLVEDGCGFCSEVPKASEAEDVRWISESIFACCDDCYDYLHRGISYEV